MNASAFNIRGITRFALRATVISCLVIAIMSMMTVKSARAAGLVSNPVTCSSYYFLNTLNLARSGNLPTAADACAVVRQAVAFFPPNNSGSAHCTGAPNYWAACNNPISSCPPHATGSPTTNPSSCTCDTGYKPSGISSGIATTCIADSTPEPAKNTAQPCANTPASAIAAQQQTACTNPINTSTGNKYQTETDYVGAGIYPLQMERIYNSPTPAVIELTVWGSQWRGFYDRTIKTAVGITSSSITQKAATVKRADGKQYYYTLSGTNFIGDADVIGSLTRIGVDSSGNATGWTYKNELDEIETYNAAGQLVSLTNRAGQTQTLTYSDGTTGANGGYILDATGAPTATVLPAGRLIRIADPAGRTLQFGYDVVGRVVLMTDPASNATRYTYSGNLATDHLTTVTYPDGKIRTYLYGETANVSGTPNAGVSYNHALTGLLDENGNRYASWTYDAAGRATSSEHGVFGSGIDHVGLSYSTPDVNGNSITTVTDPRGNIRTYNFTTILGVVKNTGIGGLPCNGCSATFSYDVNGNIASRTDFNGNRTCYAYDLTRNLETTRLEGLAPSASCPANLASYVPPTTAGNLIRKITTQWHAAFRLPVLIAEPLRITSYSYDSTGNRITLSIQATSDTTGGAGLSATPTGAARTSTYTYNTAGQVLTQDGPRTDLADITTYTYYPNDDPNLGKRGNLASVTNALGHITRITDYDANSRPLSIIDPNGLVTSLSYDVRERLISRSTGGETTSYIYDGVGQLLTVTTPSGAVYTYSYDAAQRLIGITDNLNNRISYTLDNSGNRIQEQRLDSAGNLTQSHSRVFDNLNRLYQDIGAVNQTTTYAYDAVGNLTGITDPLNRLTANSYDALNRIATGTDADNGLIQYGYDGQDQLTQVTDPRNLVTQYTRDGLNNLNQTQSPDTGTTANSYDTAGNLLSRTDAKGQTATYTYDALDRVTGISYSAAAAPAQTITYQYDQGNNGIGHLTQITDSTGITNYGYDLHGRLTGETKSAYGAIYTTAYAYDAQGRMNSITYPSGRVVNYSFDTLGRISQITTTFNSTSQILVSAIVYQPFGVVQRFNYGDGQTAPIQTYTRQLDQDGRIASYTLNGQAHQIGYDAASQIAFISDPQNVTNTASYSYDPLSRLTGYTQSALNQNYSYDPNGNRLSQTIGTTTTNYSYAPGSNRLSSVQTGSVTPQSVAQDANGATTGDGSKQYGYDLRGRLIQSTTAQGAINYEVNALGLRVRKQVPYASTDTLYHYDAAGHLIAESPNASATYTREYIYLGDLPVAVLQ